MLIHKRSHRNFKKIEIMPSNFSDPNVWNKNKKQEENWKTHKYVEIKQHATEKKKWTKE